MRGPAKTIPKAALAAFDKRTRDIARRLRDTAAELDSGKMDKHHAASRLRLIANEIRQEES